MKLFDDSKPWYKANFHTHTTVSDGRRTPEEVEAVFREHGYDILALTDHRKVSPGREEKDFILLSATELDTVYGYGLECFHVIGLDVPPDAVFDDSLRKQHPQVLIDHLRNLGAIPFLAHPHWSLNQPEQIAELKGIVGAEVYNSASAFPWNAERADSAAILDLVSARGRQIPLLATDDCHWYEGEHCRSFTMLQTDDFSVAGIRKALEDGAFYASQGPRVRQVEIVDDTVTVTCSACTRAIFYSDVPWVSARSKNVPEGAERFEYTIHPKETFLRIELVDAEGNKAWISPIALR